MSNLPERIEPTEDYMGPSIKETDPIFDLIERKLGEGFSERGHYLVFENGNHDFLSDDNYEILRIGKTLKGKSYGVYGTSPEYLDMSDLVEFFDDQEIKKWLIKEWY